MLSHELIRENSLEGYDYEEIEVNNMKLFIRSICLSNDTNSFISVLKKYYEFEVESIDTNR